MCGTIRHLLEGWGSVPRIALDRSSLEMHYLGWQERLAVYQACPVPKVSPSQKTKCFRYPHPLCYECSISCPGLRGIYIFAHRQLYFPVSWLHVDLSVSRFCWIIKTATNSVCTYNHYIPFYALRSTIRCSVLIPVLISGVCTIPYTQLLTGAERSTLNGSCQSKICACREL